MQDLRLKITSSFRMLSLNSTHIGYIVLNLKNGAIILVKIPHIFRSIKTGTNTKQVSNATKGQRTKIQASWSQFIQNLSLFWTRTATFLPSKTELRLIAAHSSLTSYPL